MRRAVPLLALFLIGARSIAACAATNESVALDQEEDASVSIPAIEAGVDEDDDAGPDVADAAPDADPKPSSCTPEGWCKVALPDARSVGLGSFRIVGLAMDGAGGVFATTNSYGFSGERTSHLLHYDGAVWRSLFGIGPQQAGPFPWILNAIADNGAGTLVAVGQPEMFGAAGAIVLRIENGAVVDEYPSLPRGLTDVAFTSPTDAWALDEWGNVYRATLGAGPLEWSLVEDVPHRPSDWGFPKGPSALFSSPEGKLVLAGSDDSSWPSRTYVIRQTEDGWAASYSDFSYGVQAGAVVGDDELWLAAWGSLLRVTETNGDLEWSETHVLKRYPNAMWARGPNEVYSVGPVGRIYRFDGTKWVDLSLVLNGAPLTTNYLTAITGSSSGELWVGGEDVALHYTPKASP